MREKLKEIGKNTRERYQATVGRMGIKHNAFKGFPERTILLKDLINLENNELVTDHLWFTVGITLKKLNLKEGDTITFNARVGSYKKGYIRKTVDYKLNNMSKIEVIREDRELLKYEITSSTEPTFEELFDAQKRARENSKNECENFEYM